MKGKKTVELEASPSIRLHNRIPIDDLKEWCGKDSSITGSNYGMELVDGRISTRRQWFPRLDIGIIQYYDLCNVFIEHDRTIQVDKWNGVVEVDMEEIQREVDQFFKDNSEWISLQTKFIRQWEDIIHKFEGLTPKGALEVLKDMGFGE